MTEQILSLSSIANARQLGGYVGAGGRAVKQNVLLRSGSLSSASQSDIAALRALGLTTVIDLRTDREAAEDPDPAIPGVAYYGVPVMGEDSANQRAIVEIYRQFPNDPGKAFLEMVRSGASSEDMYTVFFDSPESMRAYRTFFQILLEREGAVLFHCTGGKDRAGLAAVMLLGVLGVEKETMLTDFALTNAVNRERIQRVVAAARKHTDDPKELEQVAALVGVDVSHMSKVFDLAEAACGGILPFIQHKVGLTDAEVENLREKYLESRRASL